MNRKPRIVKFLPTVCRDARLVEFYGGEYDGKPLVMLTFAHIEETAIGLTVADAQFMAQSILDSLKDKPTERKYEP